MHIVFGVRGAKDLVEKSLNDLAAQYFPYKLNGQDHFLQCRVEPLAFYSVVFPEDALNEIASTMWDDPNNKNLLPESMKRIAWILRKGLGLEPMPKIDTKAKRIITKNFVCFYPIGIKRDAKKIIETEDI
jgi:hypothetical protein